MRKFFALKKLKGGIASTLIAALILPSAILMFTPKPAEAQLGGLAVAAITCILGAFNLGDILGSLGSITGGLVPVNDKGPNQPRHKANEKANTYVKGKEKCTDHLAWAAAKILIGMLGDQLIGWINGGFKGNPPFISDPAGFFLSIADNAAGNFIFGDNFEFLCRGGASLYTNLMMPQIKANLYYNHFSSYKTTNRSCGLTDVINNLSKAPDFLAGKGGAQSWDTWLTITQIPQNNIYGATLIAKTELDARVTGATEMNKQVADWNDGFKSMTTGLSDGISNVINTPGNFVKDQLYRRMETDVYQLEVADELSEVITAAIGALVGQLSGGGLAGILGSGSSGNTSPYRSGLTGAQQRALEIDPATTYTYNDPLGEAVDTPVDAYSDGIDNIVVPGGGSSVQAQEAPIQLGSSNANAYNYPCTDLHSSGFQGPAANAIDGGGTVTYSDTGGSCGVAPVGPRRLDITLNVPEYLDSIQFTTYGQGISLEGFGNPVAGPYLVLYPTADTPRASAIVITLPNPSESGTINVGLLTGNTKIKKISFESNRVMMRDVKMFRRLAPTLNTDGVPTSLPLAIASAGFNPITGVSGGAPWITATWYPTNDTPTPCTGNADCSVTVLVKDVATTIYVAPISTSPLLYQLTPADPTTPHTYQLEYSAREGIFQSATSTRALTVLP